jgi:hypothetical protein
MFVTPNIAFVDSTSWDMKLVLLEYAFLSSNFVPSLILPQESFNSRLKAEGDESSTNLYVSNLPKNMTESVSPLCAVLQPLTFLTGAWCYLHGLHC